MIFGVTMCLAMVIGLTSPLTPKAGAAPLENATDLATTPDLIWDVDTRSGLARHTGAYQTLIWDLQELDGVMYAGGDFTEVVAPDGTRSAASFLVAFDLETGAWLPGFAPQLDNVVYSLDITPGGQLVASGEFEGGVVSLDPVTGAPTPGFTSTLDHSWGSAAVFTVEPMGNSLYVGGRFVRGDDAFGNEVAVDNLAKLDTTTGAVDPAWTPSVEPVLYAGLLQERIRDIEVDPVRNRVYVGGLFASINGDPTSGSFAGLDPTTGASLFGRPAVDNPVIFLYDITLEGSLIHYGGKENFTITVDADTFVRQTDVIYTNNGDHQVIAPGANTLWIGCHCWRQAFAAPPPQNPFAPPPEAVDVNAVVAIDRVTGEVLPVTLDLRGAAGAWDIVEDSNGRLWVAGQFTRGGDRRLTALARFSVPQDPNLALTTCSVDRDGTTATVSWDGDGIAAGASRYVVRRSVNDGPSYWRGRAAADASAFVDSDRNGVISYTVEASVGPALVGPVVCTENIVATPPPSGLRSTLVTRERVVLNWIADADVEIARDGVIIDTDDNQWYTDRTVESGTTYVYEVRYLDADDWSDPITVTTL